MVKASFRTLDIVWAFNKIRENIQAQTTGLRSPAVVVMAPNSYTNNADDYPWQSLKPIMQQIFDLDSSIVVSAGNYARDPNRQNVDTLPALWANSRDFPLVVAGAVDNSGAVADFSQGGSCVTVWALGSISSVARNRVLPRTVARPSLPTW